MAADPAQVNVGALEGSATLDRDWRRLEAASDGSFFQSSGWIGCWLEMLPPELRPRLVCVEAAAQPQGLGVIVPTTVTRHRLLRSRGLFLHETGRPEFDCLTIEHNGLLAADAVQEEVVTRVLERLARDGRWDEFFAGGLDLSTAEHYRRAAGRCGLRVREIDRKPWYVVDLARVRESGGDYLALLSGNSRYQIRRSMRDYEQAGPLRLSIAETLAQAREYFDRLAGLHQEYWRSRGQPGAFAREFFGRFHQRLIEREFANGAIQLVRVATGEQEVGYLYNFVHRGRVHAYQSGFAYTEDGKRKPGLVCHALAVSHCARLGHECYDLLAGDNQYKRSLATGSDEMVWLSLQRNRVRFRLEDAARRVRDAWLSRRRGPATRPSPQGLR